jgi:hypothetical protein
MAQKGAFEEVKDVNELNCYNEKMEEANANLNELLKHQKKGCPICGRKAE